MYAKYFAKKYLLAQFGSQVNKTTKMTKIFVKTMKNDENCGIPMATEKKKEENTFVTEALAFVT